MDQFYIYYRDLAVMLTLGMTPVEIMSGFLAKEGEPLSGARQFPTHGAYPELGIVNLSNVVGTHIPQAVGVALAMKMRGDPGLVITYFGDGASSVGDCHEAMNFAAIHSCRSSFSARITGTRFRCRWPNRWRWTASRRVPRDTECRESR